MLCPNKYTHLWAPFADIPFIRAKAIKKRHKISPIIETIFYKNSPLHDGAIIISNNIIRATRVVLPINNETKISGKFGLRHRAAVSITEKTDAVAVVVSEESGKISYIKNGEFIDFAAKEDLIKVVEKDIS